MKTIFPQTVLTSVAITLPTLLCGCSGHASSIPVKQHVVVTKPVPATPLQKKSEELGGPTWKLQWTKLIERSVPQAMLSRAVPHDVQRFCPRFYKMSKPNKRAFWAYFFEALAGSESSSNKTANVRHLQPAVDVPDSVTGRMTHQEGLLQLSYKDSERYACDFDWNLDKGLPPNDPQKTILQPANNLKCGIKILFNQIVELHRPILYHASYWATLRPGTPGNLNFIRQMRNAPAVCSVPPNPTQLPRSGPASSNPKEITEAASVRSKPAPQAAPKPESGPSRDPPPDR